MKNFAIASLERGNNGRHCAIHHSVPCGSVVAVGDIIMLEKCELEDGEDAVKAMKIVDGHPTCHVAFLPRSLLKYDDLLHQIAGKHAIVKELCAGSPSTHKRYLGTGGNSTLVEQKQAGFS